jgi:hypothetical protein
MRELNPVIAADVRCDRDAINLEQFMKLIGRTFQGKARETSIGQGDADEDLAANLEAEVVGPGHVFADVRKREAKGADGVEVSHRSGVRCQVSGKPCTGKILHTKSYLLAGFAERDVDLQPLFAAIDRDLYVVSGAMFVHHLS